MKTLLTGASGFVGGHLIEALRARGHDIIAIGHKHPAIYIEKRIVWYQMNILDREALKECFKKEQPEAIIHLAAQSNVPLSWENIIQTNETNINGTIQLLEAMRATCPDAKLINIGSSEEYGYTVKNEKILEETMPCAPQNPYAISKYCAGQLALQYGAKHHLKIIHLRPFNHFGPGQKKGFAISDFASKIAEIETGTAENKLSVGNLESYRDFLYIEDIVEAYSAILETNLDNGIYNVSSNIARKIADILAILLNYAKTTITIEHDKAKIRPLEIPYFIGSSKKLTEQTNWKPHRTFEESLRKTLDWWRQTNQNPKSVAGGL